MQEQSIDLRELHKKDICEIVKEKNAIYINKLDVTPFIDEFQKIIKQSIQLIEEKLKKDRNLIFQKVLILLQNFMITQGKVDNIFSQIMKDDINPFLENVKRKYQTILIGLTDQSNDFKYNYISPFSINLESIRSQLKLNASIKWQFYYCGSFDCKIFKNGYQYFFSYEKNPLIILNKLQINTLFHNDCDCEEQNYEDHFFELEITRCFDFEEVEVHGIIKSLTYQGEQNKEQIQIGQQTKRVIVNQQALENLELKLSSKIEQLYIEISEIRTLFRFLKEISTRRVQISEIILFNYLENQSPHMNFKHFQQILSCNYLIRVLNVEKQCIIQSQSVYSELASLSDQFNFYLKQVMEIYTGKSLQDGYYNYSFNIQQQQLKYEQLCYQNQIRLLDPFSKNTYYLYQEYKEEEGEEEQEEPNIKNKQYLSELNIDQQMEQQPQVTNEMEIINQEDREIYLFKKINEAEQHQIVQQINDTEKLFCVDLDSSLENNYVKNKNRKEILKIINEQYSIKLATIGAYKLFRMDFSIFRILYDLHEVY